MNNPTGDRVATRGIGSRALREMEGDGRREKLGDRKSQGLQDHVDLAEQGCVYFTQVTLRLLCWHRHIVYVVFPCSLFR